MQPLKKTHLCVLKKYLAVAALSCAASVISVKSIAAKQDLDIKLTAEVPEKEFKLENKEIPLTMRADKTNEVFKGEASIKYLNAEKVQSLKVAIVNNPQLSLGQTESIGIKSVLIDDKELVNSLEGVEFTRDNLTNFHEKRIPLKITSESYKEVPEGKYEGTVTLQFDATISS
ncbi:hypothetical protein [Candidatus Hamiltonella defensa]|nr:hypothetical protein [Candidatus Hamiltonella defensa]